MTRTVKIAWLLFVSLALTFTAALLVSGVLPYGVYAVRTGSMEPAISSKSAVIVHKGEYRLGQVITFDTVNGVVTHRLVARNADGTLQTKGDANETVDPGSVPPGKVIGGVVAAPRMLGYWLVYFRTPAGLASLIFTLICFCLIWSITDDYAEHERQRDVIVPPSAPEIAVARP